MKDTGNDFLTALREELEILETETFEICDQTEAEDLTAGFPSTSTTSSTTSCSSCSSCD